MRDIKEAKKLDIADTDAGQTVSEVTLNGTERLFRPEPL